MREFRLVHLGVAAAIAVASLTGAKLVQATDPPGASAPSMFVSITPCRLFDTRSDSGLGPRTTPIGPAGTGTFPVRGTNGNCAIPDTATAISTNTTIVNPSAASYITVFPSDAVRPLASNINFTAASAPVANQVTVGLGASGAISVYNNAGSVDVIVDIAGYFTPAAGGSSGTTTHDVSVPGESLNISGGITRNSGAVFQYNVVQGAELAVHAPADYVPGTAVTLKVLFSPTTLPDAGTAVQFFGRSRNYNSGDPFLDIPETLGTIVTLSNLAGTNFYDQGFYESTLTFPATAFTKDWWDVIVQRNTTNGKDYQGPVRVVSVELSYTAYVGAHS
ncbi:MAG: hypothetical protein JWM34_1645 [Ilumatobacteraceae bacterium]|nr:hypothetical protein [Ilumatobacteraceae bacterium]